MPALFGVIAELTAFLGLITAVVTLIIQLRTLFGGGGPAPAAVAPTFPAWILPAATLGGMVLLCGGCGVMLTGRRADPGPPPTIEKKEKKDDDKKKETPGGGSGGGGKGEVVGRKVPVNRAVESWNDRIAVTLDAVEFRPDRGMRWHLSFLNQTGGPANAWMDPFGGSSYLIDQNGNKSNAVTHSRGTTLRFDLPAGEKLAYWIDFAAPAADATRLVAHFAADGLDARVKLPTIGLELAPGPDGPGVSGDSLVRTVRLGKALATWDAQITCTLESVEFRPDGRMRWRYSFWNKSGAATDVYTFPDAASYLTDEKGTKYPAVGHGIWNRFAVALPDGAKTGHWFEFKAPPPDAAWLTARYGYNELLGTPHRKIPDTVLHLPPGKAGPMVALTFAADAGAAVRDETIDLTIGGGAARLHVTKDRPKAEATAIVPAGTEVAYAVKATSVVTLNGKEATFPGAGMGTYTPPADRRLVFVRDTARGFVNYRALFQEPR